MTERQLPEITDAVLEQWERSAEEDADRGAAWSTNPLAVLAVVRDLRAARVNAGERLGMAAAEAAIESMIARLEPFAEARERDAITEPDPIGPMAAKVAATIRRWIRDLRAGNAS